MEAQENSVTRSRLCGSENGTDILGWRFTHQNRFPFKSSLETVRSLLVKQKNQPALGYVAVRCFQTIPMEAKLHMRSIRGRVVTVQARHLLGGRIKTETQDMQRGAGSREGHSSERGKGGKTLSF